MISKFRSGNISAFNSIFKKLYPSICSFANKYLKDKQGAEDISQEVFIELWKQREKFESIEQVKAFLYLSAKNKCLNVLKHVNVKDKHIQETMAISGEEDESFEEYVIKTEVNAFINEVIESLPPQRRKIIILSMNGLKNNEIAEELGISVNTVKLQKKIAYEKLKVAFSKVVYLLVTGV